MKVKQSADLDVGYVGPPETYAVVFLTRQETIWLAECVASVNDKEETFNLEPIKALEIQLRTHFKGE